MLQISLNSAQLLSDLRQDEGYRTIPYGDIYGNITIGIGRNLNANPLSLDEIMLLYSNDISRAYHACQTIWFEFGTFPEPIQRSLLNLAFNLGMSKLQTFGTFIRFIAGGNWNAAADDLEGTAWYNEVGGRGPRIVTRLRSATPPTPPTS